jgi:hypothetical protein
MREASISMFVLDEAVGLRSERSAPSSFLVYLIEITLELSAAA